MTQNNQIKSFLELYDLFLSRNILDNKLGLLLDLTNELEDFFKKRDDWLRVKFLINLRMSERKLSFDIGGCKTGLENCYNLLLSRKAIIDNSIEQLYSSEKSENKLRSDSCKLDLLTLEVFIFEELKVMVQLKML